MKALLIYPEFPDTFWSFRYALKVIHRKASSPPLGLLSIAAMLPEAWEKRLVDMNVESLADEEVRWADLVFVSAMSVQKESAKDVIGRCKAAGVRVVAGGPLFTTEYKAFRDVDHLVLNEAEITLPLFLEDFRKSDAAHLYITDEWADIQKTPIPLWGLINRNHYASINIQYSRGCPYKCEFCDITLLCGHRPRTKDKDQIIRELESVYASGFRGQVFFVDDNFIGNKNKLKEEVLPAIIEWMEMRRHPFSFNTQASIELSDHKDLMEMMVRAGFDVVFIGLKTPHEQSLAECSKFQNKNRDLLASVRKFRGPASRCREASLSVSTTTPLRFSTPRSDSSSKAVSSRQEMNLAGQPAAADGSYVYRAQVSASRLATDYTARVIPHCPGISVSLEEIHILWQR
jgi:radical SAM superfamily enzyme YgiQ (UPF0313 family)